jgi:sugar lactone lactonase YvrE
VSDRTTATTTDALGPASTTGAVSGAGAGANLRPPLHRPFGRGAVDKLTDVIGTPLTKVSPMLGNAYNSGIQLRTVMGNAYFVVVIGSGFLGAMAVRQTHGLAIPPALWLTLTLIVIGIFDAFSGLVATLVFTTGVIASGHLFSSHWVEGPPGTQGMLYAVTGILTMAFMWFIGPQLPRRIRLLGFNSIKDRFQRRYVILADFLVVTLLMILIMGSLPIFVPLFTGADHEALRQVTMQQHLVLIKWVVGIAAFVKVGFDEIIHAKFELLSKSIGRTRGFVGRWLMRFVAAGIALALVWEIIGTVWQWPVIWLLLISLEGLSALGERFLKPHSIYRYVPRNLFRIVTLLLFDEYMARVLAGRIVTGTELLAWLVLLLVIVVAIYAILDGPDDLEEGDRAATWFTRLVGIIVVIALFIISQNIWTVPATPYANPAGLGTNGQGFLFIADTGNGRVIEVAPDGTRGAIGGHFQGPTSVAPAVGVTPASVYVADPPANAVYRVELKPQVDLVSLGRFGQVASADAATTMVSISTGLVDPTGVATDAQGRLFIAEPTVGDVKEISSTGLLSTFASGLTDPVAVATDAFGHLFVLSGSTGNAGTLTRYLVGPNGRPKGAPKLLVDHLDGAQGVSADAQGNVFVANTGANKVFELLNNGHYLNVRGNFLNPEGLAVDGQGHLYIADSGHGRVILSEPVFVAHTSHVGPTDLASSAALAKDGSTWVVSTSGDTLEHISHGHVTVVDRDLNLPTGVCVSALGKIFISLAGDGEIDRVDPTTGHLSLVAHGLEGVSDLAPNPYGGMYAIEPQLGKILYVSQQGQVSLVLQHLHDPTSVAQDAYGYVDVTVGSGKGGGQLYRVVSAGKAEVLANKIGSPASLVADFRGDLFYIDLSQHTIYEDRGLDGYQIVWQGHSPATDPVAIAANSKGDLTIFTETPGITIHLTSTTTDYQI